MPTPPNRSHRGPARRWGGAALAAALLLGTVGCGKAADKLSEKAAEKAIEHSSGGKAKVDLDGKGGKFNVQTEDGSLSIGGGKVPDSWPKDVPLPKDFAVTSVVQSKGKSIYMSGTTSRSPAQVKATYEKTMKGWETDSEMSSSSGGNDHIRTSYKKGQRGVTVSANESDDGTMMTLIYAVENED